MCVYYCWLVTGGGPSAAGRGRPASDHPAMTRLQDTNLIPASVNIFAEYPNGYIAVGYLLFLQEQIKDHHHQKWLGPDSVEGIAHRPEQCSWPGQVRDKRRSTGKERHTRWWRFGVPPVGVGSLITKYLTHTQTRCGMGLIRSIPKGYVFVPFIIARNFAASY